MLSNNVDNIDNFMNQSVMTFNMWWHVLLVLHISSHNNQCQGEHTQIEQAAWTSIQ